MRNILKNVFQFVSPKIVAFSFYGDLTTNQSREKGYFEGIRGNLDMMPTFYPDWTMRLYFDIEPDDPIMKNLCELACGNEFLDLCDAGKLPGVPTIDARKAFPMLWRFFPTLDPQVNMFFFV